ncbi:MAG TPA: hypothetical protein VF335_07020 [Chitinivibrionales bacterium]
MISKLFSKQFSLFFNEIRRINKPVVAFLTLLVASPQAVQLDNWRFPYYQEGVLSGNERGSPSGMFWDDIGATSALSPILRPDSARFKSDHWILEPQFSYQAQTPDTLFIDSTGGAEHYVNDRKQAQRSQVRGSHFYGQLLNDIRYKRILLLQVLDVDSRNSDDVDYHGKTDRLAAGRIVEAYCRLDWKYGFFRFGRLNRNWGPFPDRSLLVSSNTQSYDAMEFQLFSSFFEFRHLFAAFPHDRSSIDAVGYSYDRYLAAHSLNIMFAGLGTVGIMETMLFSRGSGLPDFQLVNPFSLYTVINTNGEGAGNLMWGVQWDLHPDIIRKLCVKGQVIIDDFQVDNKTPMDQEPTHWGTDMGVYLADILPINFKHFFSLEYRYLSRWLYTVDPQNTAQGERYSYLGRSIGEPTNEGDRINFSFFMAAKNFWTASAGVSFARQGENSLWSMWKNFSKDSLIAPDALGYRSEPAFPSGIVERTLDMYIDARAYWKNFADIRLRMDNRWITNKNNVSSAGATYDPMVSFTLSLHYGNFFVPLL